MSQTQTSLTVPLPADLREFVKHEAEKDDRSEASVVRRLIASERERKQNSKSEAA